MRVLVLVSVILFSTLMPAFAAIADIAEHPLCPLVQHQVRAGLEERELDVDLAASRLDAAEAIFALAAELWKDELIERIRYLAFKHEKDVSALNVQRRRLLLKREEAKLDIYARFCSTSGNDGAAGIDEAQRRYEQADCHRIGKDLAIAEVDLAYLEEVLASVKDLRENDVATRDAVIEAEKDVEQARQRVKHRAPRVQACIDSGAAAGNGSP